MLSVLKASGQSPVEVITESYASGKPKVVRYFPSKAEVVDSLEVYNLPGSRYLDPPATFTVKGFYENGILQYSGQYEKGLAYGQWLTFYEDGTMSSRGYYKKAKTADSLQCWYPSGAISRLIVEVDPTKDYWHNIDYYENGNKKMVCHQVQFPDKLVVEGTYREWYENRKLGFEAVVKNGWTIGKWKMWDETGTLIQESEEPMEIK